jgi:LysR family glycine cleavage system transcriptional activator
VARPAFLRDARIRRPADLLEVPLIYDMVDDAWEEWFALCGLGPPASPRGPRVAHCELALVAAEAGQGVDLSYLGLIEKELASGRLVRIFEQETLPFTMYSIAYREIDAAEPKIRAFRNWAMSQVPSLETGKARVAGA